MKAAELEPGARGYVMVERAAAAQRTLAAVEEATLSLIPDRSWDEITLEEVARRAGVSVRTVLRRFGSKAGLGRAVAEHARRQVQAGRPADAPGDVPAAIRELVAHYEEWGPRALWVLREGRRSPIIAAAAADGSRLHEDWVARAFAPQLQSITGGDASRRRAHAGLSAATDVHTWQLLRERSGLSVRETEAVLAAMCSGLLTERS